MRIEGRWIAAALAAGLLDGGFLACHGGPCHSDGDCSGGQSCQGPDPGPSCGIPPQMGCASPSDCTAPEVCSSVTDPCSASGFGSACQPSCTANAGCGPELRCNAQGACEPIPCGPSVTCPSYQRCEPTDPTTVPFWLHTNGCTNIACQADGDCPAGGSCVSSVCQSGPGHCETPVSVP